MMQESDLSVAAKLCERIRDESEHASFTTEDYRKGFRAAAGGCVVAIHGEISKRVWATPPKPAEDRARELLLEQIPDRPEWQELRRTILAGTCDFHSDTASFIASIALRAITAALTTSPAVAEAVEALEPFAEAYRRFVHFDNPRQIDAEEDRFKLYAMPYREALRELIDERTGELLTVSNLRSINAALSSLKGDR